MSKLVSKLTKKQQTNVGVYLKKWLDPGYRTKTMDRKKAASAINFLYKIAGAEKPKHVIFLDSPMACQLASNLVKGTSVGGKELRSQLDSQLYSQLDSQLDSQLRSQLRSQLDSQLRSQLDSQLYSQLDSQLRSQLDSQLDSQLRSQLDSQLRSQLDSQLDSQLRSQLRSQLDSQLDSQLRSQKLEYFSQSVSVWWWANYYGFYDFVLNEIFPKKKKEFKLFTEFLTHWPELHYYLVFEGIAFVSDFPKAININSEARLHTDGGAALEYRDTYSVYRLNGVSVSKELAEMPASEVTKEIILKENNSDIRREIIRKIGIEKAIEVLGASVADTFETETGGKYELLMIDYDDRGKRPYLKMTDPSCGEVFILGSKPGITKAKDALEFLNNGHKLDELTIGWEA